MALKLKADILTELEAVATALTSAYADTVDGIAEEMKDPRTPLRDVNKFLNIAPDGTVTVDAVKFNAVWSNDGLVYNQNPQPIGSGTIRKDVL